MGIHDDKAQHDFNSEVDGLLDDNFLLEDLTILLKSINDQIREVEAQAHEMGIEPQQLRTSSGDWPLRSLLSAKAHTMNALVLMKTMEGYTSTMNIYYAPGTQKEG